MSDPTPAIPTTEDFPPERCAQVQRDLATEGFPRRARLTRPKEFEAVLRRPDIRLRAGPLRLNALFNRMRSARLGLIVGKKAVARAHDRNRIKRIIRERFRRERHAIGGVDMVIRVVGPVGSRDLHRYLERLFQELVQELVQEEGRKVVDRSAAAQRKHP